MALFKKLSIRSFFRLLVFLLPLQPLVMVAKTQKPASALEQALLQQIMGYMQGPSASSLAHLVMGKLPCIDHDKTIISSIERRELQIEALAKKLDKSQTSFGSIALAQSLQPTADFSVIAKRQQWVQTLCDDTDLYEKIRASLQKIKESEGALLSYWDTSQRENLSKLFMRSDSFYNTFFHRMGQFFLTKTGSKIRLDENKLALEGFTVASGIKTLWQLFFYLGIQGVITDLGAFLYAGQGNKAVIDEKGEIIKWAFDPSISFKRGLEAPFRMVYPGMTKYGYAHLGVDKSGKVIHRGKSSETFTACLMYGSWMDKVTAFTTDYDQNSAVDMSFIGRGIKKTANFFGCELKRIDEKGNLSFDHHASDPSSKKWWKKIPTYGVGASLATAITAWQAYALYEAMKSVFGQAKSFINTMKELHVHTIHLATAINAALALVKELKVHPVFKSSCIVEHMQETVRNASALLKKLLVLLKSDTFDSTKMGTHLFSRGNVLLAHRLMDKTRDEIVPLLQGVGELDALYAMATNMKENAGTSTPFSLAEFVPHAQAMVDIEGGWLPLVRNPVPNTISFGGNRPNKIIITGPNGGGKSVFLKMLGTTVIMAQSWGIVPAEKVRMTLFNGLRSCIHPEESLEHELSTFMAEKMRIDDIKTFVFKHNDPQFKVMLLLDEPFRGTVDAESADRIYDFGKDIVTLQQSIVLIATHVEKPIKLAEETNNAFANYHVCIKELPGSRFEREFKLEPGILAWWFTDAAKRSRFIDFVTMEKHKEQIAQMVQQAE